MIVEAFGRLCVDNFEAALSPGTIDRCSLVDPNYLLDMHATFTNSGVALLTLFRIATGDDWSNIMGSTSMEAGPRSSPNATKIALELLRLYNYTQDLNFLEQARHTLPICQTQDELATLSEIISCEDEDYLGYCQSTCGSYLMSSLIFTTFLCASQFVLLNLVIFLLTCLSALPA
jgi:hypothetical protein